MPLEGLNEDARECQTLAFDFETAPDDPYRKEDRAALDPHKSHIVGCSFSTGEGDAFYVPVAHRVGRNTPDPEAFWRFATEAVFMNTHRVKIAHNLAFEAMFLYKMSVIVQEPCYDTIAASQLTLKAPMEFRNLHDSGLKLLATQFFHAEMPAMDDEAMILLEEWCQDNKPELAALFDNVIEYRKPPSSERLNKPAPKSLRSKSGKSAGGQPGHKGSGMKIDREPDEVIEHRPIQCEGCPHAGICKLRCCETRYEYEAIVETKLIAHKVLGCKACALTGEAAQGTFPRHITGAKQYGPGVAGLAVSLLTIGYMSVDRVQKLLKSLRIPVSSGAMSSGYATLHRNVVSRIIQVISERTDQTVSVLSFMARSIPFLSPKALHGINQF